MRNKANISKVDTGIIACQTAMKRYVVATQIK
jgi:hypothetical protein